MRAHSSVGECVVRPAGDGVSEKPPSPTSPRDPGPRAPPPLPPPHGFEANPNLPCGLGILHAGLCGKPQNRSPLGEWSLWGDIPAGLPQQVWNGKWQVWDVLSGLLASVSLVRGGHEAAAQLCVPFQEGHPGWETRMPTRMLRVKCLRPCFLSGRGRGSEPDR